MAQEPQTQRDASAAVLRTIAAVPCIYIPDDVLRRRDLRASDKMLFAFMFSGAYSVGELAAIMHRSPRTILRQVDKLRRAGLVQGGAA